MATDDRPVRVEGTRIHRYEATDDGLRRLEFFESDALEERYGVRRLRTDEERVPAALVDYLDQPPEPGTDHRHADTAVVGRLDECRADERRRYDRLVAERPLVPDPLYVYKGCGLFDGCDDPSELAERTGPVNVAWTPRHDDSAAIESTMEAGAWGKEYPASDRYVVVDGEARSQDRHVASDVGIGGPAQWHLRCYDLPGDPSLSVAGQVHRDPVDHGLLTDPPTWAFEAGREQVTGDWVAWGYQHRSIRVENGERFPSSRGVVDAIA